MNIDRNLANRALAKAGQEQLTDKDIENESTIWRVIKGYYLQTILETLSNTEWTSQKKREKLEESESPNLTRFGYVYDLPKDCCKPVELDGQEEFMVEGRRLYTDRKDAVLMYISDGQTSIYVTASPDEETFSEKTYYTYDEETDTYNKADGYQEGVQYYMISEDDYPGYKDFEPDPMLAEYLETRLASKIVLKITGDAQLYQLLYNEALIMESRAVKASTAQSHSKEIGHPWWGDQIGLEGGL